MDRKAKNRWLNALRNKDYTQTAKRLKDETGWCCLGVLCEEMGIQREGITGGFAFKYKGGRETVTLPPQMLDDFDIPQDKINILQSMNDEGQTFAQIADWIEENL